MTSDGRAREVIAQAMIQCPFRADSDEVLAGYRAGTVLTALAAAGLRVVPVEPDDAAVERVARALAAHDLRYEPDVDDASLDDLIPAFESEARAAYAAILESP